MPPRRTTDFGTLFEALVEDLRVQLAANVDRAVADLSRRLTRIERRLDQLDPQGSSDTATGETRKRSCSLCSRPEVARGLCSAHYQQWRYRERKTKLIRRAQNRGHENTTALGVLSSVVQPISTDN